MRLFEVQFYSSAIPDLICFANKRLDLWNKYNGIRCIHLIEIT